MSQERTEGYFLFADSVEASINHDVLMVSFANVTDEDEPAYLVLQRLMAGEVSKQAVYIELNEQSTSCYGGIESTVLERNRLQLQLEPHTADKLGLNKEHCHQINIQFNVEETVFIEVRDALRQVFSDLSYSERE